MTSISSIISVLWTAFLFFSANFVASVDAQDNICSCSPTVFTFVLNLEPLETLPGSPGQCDASDISGNPGISDSFCYVEFEVDLPYDLEAFSWSWSEIDVDADEKKTSVGSNIIGRQLQDEDEDPVTEIVSVQFLEFDTSGTLTVFYQDSTYFDVSSDPLVSGDTITFDSTSSFLDTSVPLEDQMVPGGAGLILYGKTASGVVVRNRFFWLYDMNCGPENNPVQVGDSIGWVTVTETANAWPTFCPALEPGSPTIPPRTPPPTRSPSRSLPPHLTATSMSYDSSLSISTVATTLTKAGKGKASKATKTKGAKAA